MLVDRQDRVLRINKVFTQIFGYAIDDIIDRPSIDFLIPTHLKAETLKARERLAAGQHVSMETARKRKDGSYLDVSEVSFAVTANGECIAYYFIFRDITESKRAVEELHKAQTELGHLSRITTMGELAAHDRINPLAPWSPMGMPLSVGASSAGSGGKESLDYVRDANPRAKLPGYGRC